MSVHLSSLSEKNHLSLSHTDMIQDAEVKVNLIDIIK